MGQEKSLLYQLLSLFEELYPAWVSHLKKNPSKKHKVCNAYRNSFAADLNAAHLVLLKSYLKSSLNTKYRTWPPPPLELISIFDLDKKKVQDSCSLNLPGDFLTNFAVNQNSVPFLINQSIINRVPIEHAPERIRSYLEAHFRYKTHPDYMLFLRFNILYFKLRDLYTSYTVGEIVKKINDPANYAFVCQELMIKAIDIPAVMQFLKETRLNEEVFLHLEESELMEEKVSD